MEIQTSSVFPEGFPYNYYHTQKNTDHNKENSKAFAGQVEINRQAIMGRKGELSIQNGD